MDEHTAVHDDQSHYEISLTAGQAFVAFVLLLLSLAASFAFGLMLGKGQADERLVVQKEPSIVTEATLGAKKPAGEIVDVQVADDDFEAPAAETSSTEPVAADTDTAAVDTAGQPVEIVETASASPAPVAGAAEETTPAPVATAVNSAPANVAPAKVTPAAAPATVPAAAPARVAATAPATAKTPHLAQLLSTTDQKVAEALAVKLIDRGFNSAYVERGTTEKGAVYRVRVKFESEQSARAAEPKLKEFSKDVWITAR